MKKLLTQIFLLLFVMSISLSFIQCSGKANKTKDDKKIEEGLTITAVQMNAHAPVMLDAVTRFDKSEVKGTELISYYTILADTKTIDKAMIKTHILKGLKDNPETVALSHAGAVYTYIFRDSQGNDFHTFSIEAADFE